VHVDRTVVDDAVMCLRTAECDTVGTSADARSVTLRSPVMKAKTVSKMRL